MCVCVSAASPELFQSEPVDSEGSVVSAAQRLLKLPLLYPETETHRFEDFGRFAL